MYTILKRRNKYNEAQKEGEVKVKITCSLFYVSTSYPCSQKNANYST